MLSLEVFRKRGKYSPIFDATWQRVSAEMTFPEIAEEDPDQKLVYIGMIAYAAVYESALAADMSTSAAHYLARTQMKHYKLSKPISKAVDWFFSGTDDPQNQAYADLLRKYFAQIVTMNSDVEGDVAPLMQEMAQAFIPQTLS